MPARFTGVVLVRGRSRLPAEAEGMADKGQWCPPEDLISIYQCGSINARTLND